MGTVELALAIIVMALITFGQKYLPFVVLSSIKNSKVIDYLAIQLPPSIMIILTLYALRLEWQGVSSLSLIPITAALFTAFFHILLRKPLISIAVGVFVYAFLQSILNKGVI